MSNNDVEISILPYIALFTYVYVNNAMQGRIEKFYPMLRCIISIPTCIAISDTKISIPPYIAHFYPYFHCSFWPQVLNNDVEISILPYIALFTCVYVNNVM